MCKVQDELSEELQVEQAEEDVLIEAVVTGAAEAMAAGCVSGKWQCVMEDLAPLVKAGKLEKVVEILMGYWPPESEIAALVEYSTAGIEARV